MYASKSVPCSTSNYSDSQPKIPVETYDNRAVLEELARRNNAEQYINSDSCDHKCSHHAEDNSSCEQTIADNPCKCNSDNNVCRRNKGLFNLFGADDALILLIIILTLTDGNDNNDIILPILLGLLLLT